MSLGLTCSIAADPARGANPNDAAREPGGMAGQTLACMLTFRGRLPARDPHSSGDPRHVELPVATIRGRLPDARSRRQCPYSSLALGHDHRRADRILATGAPRARPGDTCRELPSPV